MLKKTTTTEFKPKSFLGDSSQTSGLGGADTSHKPAIYPTIKTPKEVLVQEGPSQRQLPKVGVNEQYFNNLQESGSRSVSVAIHTYIHVSYVVNCSINNNLFQCALTPSPNSALQQVQKNLVPNTPSEHSSSTGRLCMALTN